MGFNGRSTVSDNLKAQKIDGTPDMTPAAITAEAKKAGLNVSTITIPSCSVANKTVTNGATARCFAQYMNIHALEATGGQLYSQMPRFATLTARARMTNARAEGKNGQPVDNPARGGWIYDGRSTALRRTAAPTAACTASTYHSAT